MKIYLFLAFLVLSGCIGFDIVEDEVEPVVVILNPIDSLKMGEQYQLEAMYLNNVGRSETVDFNWSTSNDQIISITADGLAEALTVGNVTIMAEYELASEAIEVHSGSTTSIVEQD